MNNPLIRRASLVLASLSLCACSVLGKPLPFFKSELACAAAPDKTTGMQLDLVRQQMDAGKYHSALAYLDTLDNQPETLLLRARAQRSIGASDAAWTSYGALLNTCLRAYGEQGLGIIAADRRDLDQSLAHLREARQLAPTDAQIRNDYGFALLAFGDLDAALNELQTAVELESDTGLAARNLVLTLFVAQRADEAWAVAGEHAIGQNETAALARRAAHYRPMQKIAENKSDAAN